MICEGLSNRVIIGAAIVAVAVAAAPAQADVSKSQKLFDRALAIKDEARVITDGNGRYIAIYVHKDTAKSFVFYGSKTSLAHQKKLNVIGASKLSSKSNHFSIRVWDPRGSAKVDYKNGRWSVKCELSDDPWTELSSSDRKKFLRTSKWKAQPLRHEPYALGRDDFGNYYYVDRIGRTTKGFRLFRGRPGQLKKLRLVDTLTDTEGDLFVSKAGSLRLSTRLGKGNVRSRGAVEWIERKKGKVVRTIVRNVPIFGNTGMIYTKLGVYSDVLGTPCDI